MTSSFARTLLVAISAICVVAGLFGLGSASQYESNLALGLFVIGGVAALLWLALHAQSRR